MRIIEPSVNLVDITPNIPEKIASHASVCTGKKIKNPEKFVTKLVRAGHWSTLRVAHARFIIICSRVCSHQFVRKAYMAVCQQSQRYKEQTDEVILPYNDNLSSENNSMIVASVIDDAYDGFKQLLISKVSDEEKAKYVPKEDARYILPNATTTSLSVEMNMQGWIDFLKLRLDPHAQDEIRHIANLIIDILKVEVPYIFEIVEPFIYLQHAVQKFMSVKSADEINQLTEVVKKWTICKDPYVHHRLNTTLIESTQNYIKDAVRKHNKELD